MSEQCKHEFRDSNKCAFCNVSLQRLLLDERHEWRQTVKQLRADLERVTAERDESRRQKMDWESSAAIALRELAETKAYAAKLQSTESAQFQMVCDAQEAREQAERELAEARAALESTEREELSVADIGQKLLAAMRESDEWAMPADLLRSLDEQGLSVCTAAERKVLQACAEASAVQLQWCIDHEFPGHWLHEACDAELARRGGTDD